MKILDHTDPEWSSRVTRVNGALTYSKDLVKYQIPKWQEVLTDDDIISTCPKFSDSSIRGDYRVAIQYLHSYPYYGAIQHVERILWNKKFKAEKLIFITAYKQFERELLLHGLNAVYIPMGIDTGELEKYRTDKMHDNRIIYFGNVVINKLKVYNSMRKHCQMAGFHLDLISHSVFNTRYSLNRDETIRKISSYKYGIGVGRCAQELMSLDVKTIVAGQKFGGIITTKDDYQEQLRTNINGRIYTHSNDIEKCLKDIDESKCYSNDIQKLNHPQMLQNKFII